MSASKVLLKGSALRTIVLVTQVLVGFYLMPFLVHALGDEQYGIWVLVLAIVSFYGLLDAGLGIAIGRFIVRSFHDSDKDAINVALSSSVFLFSIIGFVSLFLTLVIVLLVPSFVEAEQHVFLTQVLIGIVGIKTAVLFPFYSFNAVLMAKYRFDILSYINLVTLIFRTVFIIAFVNYGYGIVSVAAITSFEAMLASIGAIYYAKRLVPDLRLSYSLVSRSRIKAYFDFGKYAYITTIADRIRFSIDDLVIGAHLGAATVTHYTIASTLITYFGEAMLAIFGIINPVLTKYHKLDQVKKLKEVFLVATELSALVSVLFGGLLIVLGEPFIQLWMGEDYTDVYSALAVLTLASVIANAQRPSVAVLNAIAKHQFYAKITSIEAVVNIILSLTLVQFFGMLGVALGTVIPLLVNKLIFQPLYTCKQLGLSPMTYYLKLSKFFAFGIVIMTLFYYFNKFYYPDSYIKLIFSSLIVCVAYFFVQLRWIISNNTKTYLSQVIPNKFIFLLGKME